MTDSDDSDEGKVDIASINGVFKWEVGRRVHLTDLFAAKRPKSTSSKSGEAADPLFDWRLRFLLTPSYAGYPFSFQLLNRQISKQLGQMST